MSARLVLVLALLVPGIALGQSGQSGQSEDPATALGRVILQGVVQAAAPVEATPKQAAPAPGPSWPELTDKYADRILDSLGTAAKKTEEVLTAAAPTVWKALVAKQLAYGLAFLFFLVTWVLLLLAWKATFGNPWIKDPNTKETVARYRTKDGQDVMCYIIPSIFLLAMVVMTLVMAWEAVPRLVAPEWYAIQDITEAATKILHGGGAR